MNGQNAKVDPDSGAGREPVQGLRPGRLTRLAWLPIPLLAAAIIAGRAAGLSESYKSETLTLVLSFTFYTLVSLGTLFLVGRSFLVSGAPGLLLLECGVVLWSLSGTVGDAVSHGNANVNVTIFNTGILLAGLCHLAGAILSLRVQRVLRPTPLWLGAGVALALGMLWLVTHAALANRLPVFFIPGQGGTPVRYFVLIAAIAMFVLSAGLLLANQRRARAPFISWYALALLLLAVGLFGVMIQLSLGSVVNWLGRTAQWLGGVYLLLAAVAALRESDVPLLPPEKKPRPERYRYGVAIAIVLAATAVRLALSSLLGMSSPFITFYPAVILSALYGGGRAGLLATVLSVLIVVFFWIEPVGQFAVGSPTDWATVLFFMLSCTMIAWAGEAMHKARARLVLQQDHLEELVKNRTAELQREVVERKQAEDTLQKAYTEIEQRVQERTETLRQQADLIELSHEAIVVRDLESGILFWSSGAEETYGWTKAEALGNVIHSFLKTRWSVPFDEHVAVLMRVGRWEGELVHTRKDGSELTVLSRQALRHDEDGKPVDILEINIDITERKRAEDEIRRYAAQLEASNRELQDFAFVASHDLQEPLRKIRAFGDQLKTEYGTALGAEGADYLERMQSAATRMQALIQALLNYSRVTTKARPFSRADLAASAREAVSNLEASIRETGGEVEIGELAAIEADPVQMVQLFQNLIGNALKFHGEKRPVVRVFGLPVDRDIGKARSLDRSYNIFVEDNGIGFDEKYLDRIFTPFQRLHGRGVYEGTGIGLAICRKIVDRHGGTIIAKSAPGEGTTFIVSLPVKQPKGGTE